MVSTRRRFSFKKASSRVWSGRRSHASCSFMLCRAGRAQEERLCVCYPMRQRWAQAPTDSELFDDDSRSACTGRLAEGGRSNSCCDGSDGGVLAASMGSVGRTVRIVVGEPAPYQSHSGTEDRCTRL